MPGLTVRRLVPADSRDFGRLRREALLDAPLALSASPETDVFSDPDSVREFLGRADGSAIFGAFQPHLVGCVGLLRSRHAKLAHKLDLWGMWVAPGYRGRGAGAQLMEAAIAYAREVEGADWIHLAVGMPEARRLYERFGFRVWGTELDALRHGSVSVDEHHMALRLGPQE